MADRYFLTRKGLSRMRWCSGHRYKPLCMDGIDRFMKNRDKAEVTPKAARECVESGFLDGAAILSAIRGGNLEGASLSIDRYGYKYLYDQVTKFIRKNGKETKGEK